MIVIRSRIAVFAIRMITGSSGTGWSSGVEEESGVWRPSDSGGVSVFVASVMAGQKKTETE